MTTKNGINSDQAFENTSTNVAASQMRNALNKLVDTVTDPNEKKVSVQPVSFQSLTKSSVSRLRWTTFSPSSAGT